MQMRLLGLGISVSVNLRRCGTISARQAEPLGQWLRGGAEVPIIFFRFAQPNESGLGLSRCRRALP